jgi:hypothetical protein
MKALIIEAVEPKTKNKMEEEMKHDYTLLENTQNNCNHIKLKEF